MGRRVHLLHQLELAAQETLRAARVEAAQGLHVVGMFVSGDPLRSPGPRGDKKKIGGSCWRSETPIELRTAR